MSSRHTAGIQPGIDRLGLQCGTRNSAGEPRPTCPYGLVCPLTSRPQHRVCEVKKQTRDGTGKGKTKKKKEKNKQERRGERGEEERKSKKKRGRRTGATTAGPEPESEKARKERRVEAKRAGTGRARRARQADEAAGGRRPAANGKRSGRHLPERLDARDHAAIDSNVDPAGHIVVREHFVAPRVVRRVEVHSLALRPSVPRPPCSFQAADVGRRALCNGGIPRRRGREGAFEAQRVIDRMSRVIHRLVRTRAAASDPEGGKTGRGGRDELVA